MSDTDDETTLTGVDAAAVLTETETFTGTVEIRGETIKIEVAEPTLGELDAIADETPEGDETEEVRAIIDRYLQRPDIDAGDVPMGVLMSLFEAMRDIWTQAGEFEAAQEEMPLSGNR
jgi:hypothetical protein